MQRCDVWYMSKKTHGLTSQTDRQPSNKLHGATPPQDHNIHIYYIINLKKKKGMCFYINYCLDILKTRNTVRQCEKSCNILVHIDTYCNLNIIIWNSLYLAVFHKSSITGNVFPAILLVMWPETKCNILINFVTKCHTSK